MVGVDWRGLVLVVVLGVCIGLVTGFVENPPEVSVIGHKYYGWPFVWRITKMFLGEEYLYFELFVLVFCGCCGLSCSEEVGERVKAGLGND